MKKKFELHGIWGDGMVIQHGVKVPVWGRSDPYMAVEVRFRDKAYTAAADEKGGWKIILDPSEPGGPHRMEVRAGDAEADVLVIHDIYAGDVWICSGQSNMELPMARLKDEYPGEWAAPNPLIRQFPVPTNWDFTGPRTRLSGGPWIAASPETLHDFSGAGWFFAKKISEKHHIPIGLIKAAVGGSPIEAWMSREALEDFPHKIAESAVYGDPAFVDARIRENEEAQEQWRETVQNADPGLSPAAPWFSPDLDDSAWPALDLPGDFSAAGLEAYCGSLWLRRTITVPPALAAGGADIWLGTIVDADTVYINGREVGGTSYRYPPRKYAVPPGLLREGPGQITIRVVCNNGGGGVTRGKPFRIFSGGLAVELAGPWKYQTGGKAPPKPAELHVEWRPCGLFNAMIAPLLPYPVRGVLWYQGEANTEGNAEEYPPLFLSLIRDWRNKKQQPNLPFLFVQLPLFGEPAENTEQSRWALIRDGQFKMLEVPHTGMAAALDLGEWNDLHPLNKKDVGFRLALAAETVVYREETNAPGPVLKQAVRENNRLLLTFDKTGAGLVIRDEPQNGGPEGGLYLTVISQDEQARRVPAKLKGPNQVLLDMPPLKNPVKVLYAWADNPADRQLYNADGLPAVPFKICI